MQLRGRTGEMAGHRLRGGRARSSLTLGNAMHYSGYQIESVLRQLRRLRGMLFERLASERGDTVELSDEGRERARTVHLVSPGETPRTVLAIYDATRYPPAIERELNRRAETFLDTGAEESEDGT